MTKLTKMKDIRDGQLFVPKSGPGAPNGFGHRPGSEEVHIMLQLHKDLGVTNAPKGSRIFASIRTGEAWCSKPGDERLVKLVGLSDPKVREDLRKLLLT